MEVENMKTNFKVKDIEEKEGKTGEYLLVKSEKGNFSCWKKELFDTLKGYLGTDAEVTVKYESRGDFKNITDVIIDGQIRIVDTPEQAFDKVNKFSEEHLNKQNSIERQVLWKMCSDVFISMYNAEKFYKDNIDKVVTNAELGKRAIAMVTGFKEAFK